jgi:hypothetical protein
MRAAATPWTLLLLLASIAPVAGCKAKPGDSCQRGTVLCLDEHTELSCQGGRFIAAPCKGAKGCAARGEPIECDVSANLEGDVCSTEDENKGACAADGKSMISCRSGTYEVMPCRGPDACKATPTGATCDSSIAEEGDRCTGDGSACSIDGKRMLGCQGGRYAMKWHCRGADACKDTGKGELHCDYSVAEVGDACDSTGGACTSDRKQMLTCKDGKFVTQSFCRGAKGCKDEGDHLSCDGSLAEVGDPCDPEDAACQVDGKAFLECKGGNYGVERACRCVVEGDSVLCK